MKYITGIFITLVLGFSLSAFALAQTTEVADSDVAKDAGFLTGVTNPCWLQGDCTMCDVIVVFNNVILFILGVVGSLCLLFFIYAGFKIIISAGDSGKIGEAKGIFKNAVIGLALVFFSIGIVNFALNIIVGSATPDAVIEYGNPAKLFGTPWLDICKGVK